jgi:enamine deaminase RidA (YjgF/YER057c/UK114 family)
MIFASDNQGDLVFITAIPTESSSFKHKITQAYSDIQNFLDDNNCTLMSERIYGRVASAKRIQSLRKQTIESGSEQFKLHPTFVEGKPFYHEDFAGVHIIAARNGAADSLQDLRKNGVVCGREFHGEEAEYVILSDLASVLPDDIHADKSMEAYETIRVAGEILQERNWTFQDVRRTWFYLEDILDWYDDFNVSRSRYFHESGLMNGSIKSIIPASTGIWGRNAHGFATTMDLLAMRPSDEQKFEVKRMLNPKQNEATDYGSAFSRGVSVDTKLNTYAFVSGTASIDETGKSIHPNDMEKQTARTFDNIDALLQGVHGDLHSIVQATAFVKHEEDIPVYEAEIEKRGLQDLPIIQTVADVCRDDLLFELDATAIISK